MRKNLGVRLERTPGSWVTDTQTKNVEYLTEAVTGLTVAMGIAKAGPNCRDCL